MVKFFFGVFRKKLVGKFMPEVLSNSLFECYAYNELPNDIVSSNKLAFEVRHDEFTMEEVFEFGERGKYNGIELEEYLTNKGLSAVEKERERALFRFAYNTGILGYAMQLRGKNREYICEHPFDDIDGLSDENIDETKLHLDIFTVTAVDLLGRYISGNEFYKDKEMMAVGSAMRLLRSNPTEKRKLHDQI